MRTSYGPVPAGVDRRVGADDVVVGQQVGVSRALDRFGVGADRARVGADLGLGEHDTDPHERESRRSAAGLPDVGAGSAMKIVSLVPSVTETLLAWDITPVACTRYCEQPDLRHVGGTKNPDVDAIIALSPDLVVLDAEENRREDHDALVAAGISVHALRRAERRGRR